MRYDTADDLDRYDDDAQGAFEADYRRHALLVEYRDAHAALATVRDDGSQSRSERWAIFERFAAAAQAVEAERDADRFEATNAAIVHEIRGAA
jgi:hypothetical protein